jgi:transcriptional regulator with GAF, ATPase, and Fis domain
VVTQSDRERLVGDAFVALADTLVDDYDIIDLLDQLIAHCLALLAADAGGILLADPRQQLRPVAASSEDAQTMDLLQLQADEGPCLEAYRHGVQVRIPDLAREAERWPRFVAAVAQSGGYASVYAIPLRLRRHAIGALNLFHREPGPLPESDLALGQALADVATIGILQERAIRRGEVVNEQLQTALNSRVLIEQAKGVVAQHFGLAMNTAFELLRRYARDNNQRLAELARRLVNRELDLAVLASALPRTAPRSS